MEQIPARPAATIVLIRDHDAQLEILMLRRNSKAAAAPGAHVFPGGTVDDEDHEVVRRGLFVGLDEARACHRLGLEAGALAFYCASVRELFEEAGVLLAHDRSGHAVAVERTTMAIWRDELDTERLAWSEFLEREHFSLSLGEVEYLAHWVTPEARPHRFDTRFFVARIPEGQCAQPDGREVVEHLWMTASDALDRHTKHELDLLLPTRRTLANLMTMRGVKEVLQHAATAPVTRIQPREIVRDGSVVVVVPGEPGYDN
jgi:8-oxo-dGTP pyrophosphatase MutT (NUDIX family)